ncbi:UDP-glucose 4-epimerase [Gloeomargarita lithophora Alchichica-D10]|uniref:UDP-glucose 4-epimerase n=1 Tax=Gloeomargarita lithophora Alchichica-D10 TaxID=1188229 RepID=A0A1J0A9T0_9CYAN|nr:UDP-glucose 4-epimerase GalE [Gloeomargarita lithophora]APB32698.1 UDP-glucose 4-epimerase [Gloeomargarita lithophora Alchichica-D10]
MLILVTGGAGYIGSHTCKALAQAGFTPVVLDNFSTGHLWAVRWGEVITGDLADRELLVHVLKKYDIQAVVHFAASIEAGESMRRPDKYFRNNFINTLNLLEAMVETGVNRLIFSSTCAIYGEPQWLPLTENHPQNPVNPYGESKRAIEQALHWFSQAYGMQYAALRYFNAAGADLAGELGECHDPETHLIPRVLLALLAGTEIQIFGTDYDTPDGTAVRDFIHVADLAQAHVQALHYVQKNQDNLAVNLGTGRGYSVREVIAAVEQVTGQRVRVRETARRLGDAPMLVADVTLAQRELGWRCHHSDLHTIVQTAWKWHQGTYAKVQN